MGCISRAQNLKFRAQNFDLHRSDPQRSGTPDSVSARAGPFLKCVFAHPRGPKIAFRVFDVRPLGCPVAIIPQNQDAHFLLQDPQTLELIFKHQEAQRITMWLLGFVGRSKGDSRKGTGQPEGDGTENVTTISDTFPTISSTFTTFPMLCSCDIKAS